MLIPLLAEVHKDEVHWTNPEQFLPERFIDHDDLQIIRHAAFMPFQTGSFDKFQ
jgi:cytochrome P450